MRRLFLSVAALIPLAVLVGCHMAGQCDCVNSHTIDCPCGSHTVVPVAIAAPAPTPVKPVEPIKEAPKPKTDNPDK